MTSINNIKDLAQLANVSVATISRVLNNSPKVKPSTRDKILKLIDQYNFQPNIIARNLKTQTNCEIGLLIPRISSYYEDFVETIMEKLLDKGYNTILATTISKFRGEIENFYIMQKKRVAGIIYYSAKFTDKHKKAIIDVSKNIPVVIAGSGLSLKGYDTVRFNDYEASFAAVNYLHSKGHVKQAIIRGPDYHIPAKYRFDGFFDGCNKLNVTVKDHWIKKGCYSYSSGYDAMLDIINSDDLPTAVFCCNDSMAMGAINACRYNNLKVPDDISILGFDNIKQSAEFRPKISTIEQNLVDMADNCVDLILNRIKTADIDNRSVVLDYKIIERESVKSI